MSIDCSNYENCPNKNEVQIKLESEQIKLGIVGCWGVYCQNDKIIFTNYSLDDKKINKLWDKEDLKYQDFLKTETKIRGQKTMSEYLKNFQPFTSLFLAGDNIYEYSEISDILIKELNDRIEKWKISSEKSIEKFKDYFVTNSIIKNDRSGIRELYKNLDITLQFSKSFGDCFHNLQVGNYFLALGNHDIETCDILNHQMNHEINKEKVIPGSYYNVIYKDKNDKDILNVIVLDTNLFEPNAKDCAGNPFLQEMIQEQIDWFRGQIENIKKINCPFNIVIGHIPYKAIGHKSSNPFIHNQNLDPIFAIIKQANEVNPVVQAYFCADEHDQQILYDTENKLHLIIVGSGGTTLDDIFGYDDEDENNLANRQIVNEKLIEHKLEYKYTNSKFGFSILNIDTAKKILDIEIYDAENKKSYHL
jgi:hypothetical protein